MKKGGYQIIDLKGTALTKQVKTVIDGVYEAVEGAYNKRLVLSGCVFDGKEFDDVEVQARVSGKTFTCSAYGYAITISDDNGVTISQLSVANATGDTVTVTQFNNLLAVLKSAGIIQ